MFLGGMSPWAHLAFTHRNVASRPQRGLKDSSEGPFLSCNEHSINEHYYYCCCYYFGYDYTQSKTQQLFFKSVLHTVLFRGRTMG